MGSEDPIRDFFGESIGIVRPRYYVRRIRRQRGEPSVLYWSTDGKVVEGLVLLILETEEIMN